MCSTSSRTEAVKDVQVGVAKPESPPRDTVWHVFERAWCGRCSNGLDCAGVKVGGDVARNVADCLTRRL